LSRRGAQCPGAAELVAELGRLGAHAELARGDVARRDDVARVLAEVPAAHPLTAVVHAAGVLDDGLVESLTDGQLENVLAPKVDGAWHLHELTRELDLAEFTCFSSAAGVFGTAGQGAYAAANAFLDALMNQRAAAGLPARSLGWGLWAPDTGTSTTDGATASAFAGAPAGAVALRVARRRVRAGGAASGAASTTGSAAGSAAAWGSSPPRPASAVTTVSAASGEPAGAVALRATRRRVRAGGAADSASDPDADPLAVTAAAPAATGSEAASDAAMATI
ncbi:ketoreductase domain-containing protein, partial [Streptomyces sp. NPDC020125]|uniref:ketoreductase domain-containing protein n=1 Tax=Streptomyces sp. NPDC020125 TaxID=3154593 RepID=UPI0033C02C58